MYRCFGEFDVANSVGTCLATQSTPAEWTIVAVVLIGVALVSWLAWLGEFDLRDI